jgi:hypothetical protein
LLINVDLPLTIKPPFKGGNHVAARVADQVFESFINITA